MNRNRAREEEFERVAMMHMESLLRAALRLTEARATAEDLVRRYCGRAFEQYAPGTNCKAWLFRILFNCANERRRRKSVRPKLISFDDCAKGDANSMQTAPPAHSHPEVIRALDDLTEEHRVVLILVVVEGFTCKEVARMLDVPIGTAMGSGKAVEGMNSGTMNVMPKGFGVVRPLGLIDGLDVNFSGLEPGQVYQLALDEGVSNSKAGKAEPLTIFKADEKGKAMGQSLSPLRQVMQEGTQNGRAPLRRRLVLRLMTGNQIGGVVLESALDGY